jgi:N-hydroxyarylamine O-acetyltransferase
VVFGPRVHESFGLELETPQHTPHETRRIVATGEWQGLERRAPDAVLYHQILYGETWSDVCEFTLEEMHPVDRELGNWFTSTHPDSHFRTHARVARSTETGRITLMGRELKHRASDGQAIARTLETHSQVLETLHEEFGLMFPAGTRFD